MRWEGELYLELHNGTYTSVAEIKNYCRRMEILLRDLELASSLASLIAQCPYPLQEITDMWHTFLIDQFHDVLPGTCIGLAYVDTRRNFQELSAKAQELMGKAMAALIGEYLEDYSIIRLEQLRPQFEEISFENEGQSAVLFNTLGQDRFEAVRYRVGEEARGTGQALVSKFGFACVDKRSLEESKSSLELSVEETKEGYKVVNRYYKIVIGTDGQIHSWLDKRPRGEPRELCRAGQTLNRLTIHQDVPFFWDAWDIMLHSFETQTLQFAVNHTLTENTASRVRLSFTYKLAHSSITQTLVLHADTPRVDFVTEVDWHEEKKLLKAYFPLDIRSDFATFDI